MKVVIDTQNILDDVDGVFLRETGDRNNMPQRGVLMQYLNEANARVIILIGKYYEAYCQEEADDSLGLADKFVYGLLMSPRREMGKAQAITDTIHSFLVNLVLAKVFTNAGLAELGAKHEAQYGADGAVLQQLIHSKRPPVC